MKKKCGKCCCIKPLTEFYKDRGKSDGHAGYCKVCNSAHCSAHYAANREKAIARVKARAEECAEGVAAYQRDYYRRNARALIAAAARHQRENPEQRRISSRRYDQQHRAEKLHRKKLYEARKKRALPAWADLKAIKEFYMNRPAGYHVDHIVPFVAMQDGTHVACGLHCEANLQYLTAVENMRKGTKLSGASR